VRRTMLAPAHVQRLVRLTGFVKVVMRAASSPFRSSCKLLEDGSRISEHARGKNDQHVGNRLICNARLEPIKVGQRPRSG
jgi:hypothetical protein